MTYWQKGVLIVGALVFGGCATLFPPPPQGVSFQSTPPGASVSVNGVGIGSTPVTFPVSCTSPQEVSFTLEGYRPYVQSIPRVAGWQDEGIGLVAWPVDHCAPVVSVVLAPLSVHR